MARKPTGRPPGRPKTKDYETLLARVPSDLADKVKRYAARHRCSVAELIRDGLEMRLDAEGVPGRTRPPAQGLPNQDDSPSMPDNGNTEIHELSPMLREAIAATVLETLAHVQSRTPGEHGEAVIQQSPFPVLQHDTGESQDDAAALAPEQTALDRVAAACAPARADDFDHTRYVLGPLCKRGHDWQGTGQTLQYAKNHFCRECDIERKRAARRRTTAAQEG
jgi:hypothetical protein